MFNLNAVVVAFNLTPVEAGSFQDKYGFVFTYRPVFHKLEDTYGTRVASTSFVDAEDLFYSFISYDEIKLVPVVTQSMLTFIARLEAVKSSENEYTIQELFDCITKYENRYSTHQYDEVRFYAIIRQELKDEFARLGVNTAPLSWVYAFVEENLHYRKDYNS